MRIIEEKWLDEDTKIVFGQNMKTTDFQVEKWWDGTCDLRMAFEMPADARREFIRLEREHAHA